MPILGQNTIDRHLGELVSVTKRARRCASVMRDGSDRSPAGAGAGLRA
ncbi:Uncharacterised protein [Bordetella pertussis]|nr:Uncharacterised protein [Bordetella pertussis]